MEISTENAQKILTWLAGVVAGAMVYVAGQMHIGLPPDVANMLAMAMIAWASGYVKQHFAEREKLCPQCQADKLALKLAPVSVRSDPPPPVS